MTEEMRANLEEYNRFEFEMMMMLFLFMGALPLGIGVSTLFLLTIFGVPHNVAVVLTIIPMGILFVKGTSFAKSWCWQRWQRIVEGDEN